MAPSEILQIISDILMAIIGILSGHHVIRNHLKDRKNKPSKKELKMRKNAIKLEKLQEKIRNETK